MEESKGQVENILRELGKKIDELIHETRGATDEVRDEIEKKIEELKKKKDTLEDDWEEYKKNEKWQEAKVHFSSAFSELRAALDTIFTRKTS
jgi:Sec-independent protein translocase protein TatA